MSAHLYDMMGCVHSIRKSFLMAKRDTASELSFHSTTPREAHTARVHSMVSSVCSRTPSFCNILSNAYLSAQFVAEILYLNTRHGNHHQHHHEEHRLHLIRNLCFMCAPTRDERKISPIGDTRTPPEIGELSHVCLPVGSVGRRRLLLYLKL